LCFSRSEIITGGNRLRAGARQRFLRITARSFEEFQVPERLRQATYNGLAAINVARIVVIRFDDDAVEGSVSASKTQVAQQFKQVRRPPRPHDIQQRSVESV
jgi:hypothetical protein